MLPSLALKTSFVAGMAQDVYTKHGNVTTIQIAEMDLTNFIAIIQQLHIIKKLLLMLPSLALKTNSVAGMAQNVYTNHGNVTTIQIAEMGLMNLIVTIQL